MEEVFYRAFKGGESVDDAELEGTKVLAEGDKEGKEFVAYLFHVLD
jgi:hypothetical protein